MFKKFKDKIAEEMKQSPARLQASMQQLAQAVVSPSLSNNSIQDLSFKDNFSLNDETDETPRNSPVKHGFQTVDLTAPFVNSRRSSVSSNISDASFLLPIYESPGNMYHLQSDIDQSASEVDDNIPPQLDHVSKEQLYAAYRKAKTKYDKYRGRYTDLAAHYKEIERTKTKLESLLVETQDKALRRISDLKEQCQLEQQAKAHLEDALRNDIEEKDHVINSLRTKIKLIQEKSLTAEGIDNGDVIENYKQTDKVDILVDVSNNAEIEQQNEELKLSTENAQLKDKIQKMETFLEKYKDMLKRSKDKIFEITTEKNTLQRDYDILQKLNKEQLDSAENKLHTTKSVLTNIEEENRNLKEEIDVLKKREEESVISLAENKLSIHRELEDKEEQIKQLRLELKQAIELEKSYKDTLEMQKQELEQAKLITNQSAESSQEHLGEKTETLKHLKKEMQQKLTNLEEVMRNKYDEVVKKNRKLVNKLEDLEKKSKELQQESKIITNLKQELQEKETHLIKLNVKNIEYEKIVEELTSQNRVLNKDINEFRNSIESKNIIDNNSKDNYEKEINDLKQQLNIKDEICEKSNFKIQEYAKALEQFKEKVQSRNEEIKSFQSKTVAEEKISKLQEELENTKTEILGLTSELKSSSTTITDLKREINNLINHRNSLVKHLKLCKKIVKCVKEDYISFKSIINNNILNSKCAISETVEQIIKVLPYINKDNERLQLEINELLENAKILEEFKRKCTDSSMEYEKVINEKGTLEKQFKEKCNEIEEMKIKTKNFEELENNNAKFVLEIKNLNSKLSEFEKLCNERQALLYKAECNKENILESISLEKETYDIILKDLNLKLTEKENLSEEFNKLLQQYKQAMDLVNSLKLKNEENNNLIEVIQNLRTELTYIKEQFNIKDSELKTLQLKYDEREQQTQHECEHYKKLIKENNEELLKLHQEFEHSKEITTKLINVLQGSDESLQKTINEKTGLTEKLNNLVQTLQNSIEDKNRLFLELEQERSKLHTIQTELNKIINSKLEENEEIKKQNSILTAELNEVKISKNELDSLKNEKLDTLRELKELKALHELLTTENINLKDNQNDLLKLNEVLKQSQNELTEKLSNWEKKNDSIMNENSNFLQELESYKHQLNNANSEIEYLKKELIELDKIKNQNIELSALLDDAKYYKQLNENLSNDIRNMGKTNEELNFACDTLKNKIIELENQHKKSEIFAEEMHVYKNKANDLENYISSQEGLAANLKIELEEKRTEIKALEMKNDKLLQEIDEIATEKLHNEEKSAKEINKLIDVIKVLECDKLNANSTIKELEEKYSTLEDEIKNVISVKLKDEELSKNIQDLTADKRKLESQLDETLVTFQTKETQMQALNGELRNQVIKLRNQLKVNDEEQSLRLKQMGKEFQAQLHDKEKELQAALEKRFDRQQNYESDTIHEFKEQLKDFQLELIKKSEHIEELNSDNQKHKKESEEEFLVRINQIKLEHIEEMQELENRWKNILKQKTNQLESKHEQEIAKLSSEWQTERKNDENTELLDKELENTTRVSMAAVQSNTVSFHTLQQTLLSQKRELAELRKLVKLRQESVEDSTEIEYLRNILYKYMMGKETMVLAKVIAAVVKFDQEQTSKILKKEEDKLSLLGSLGLT